VSAAGHLRSTARIVRFVGSTRYRQNPYPAYRHLRSDTPILKTPMGVWILTGHPEVSEALRNPALSSSDSHIDASRLRLGPLRRLLGREAVESGPFFERAPRLMLFRDPPDHTRLRRLVSRVFTARRVQEMEPRITAIAADLLDELPESGEFDLMSQFAYPFPARVICDLIGVPPSDVESIIACAPGLAAGLDPGPLLTAEAKAAANAAMVGLVDYLGPLLSHRRVEPADDLLSALLAERTATSPDDAPCTPVSTSSMDPEQLSDDEIIETVLLLLIAGHETTANLIGNGVVALLHDRHALAELQAAPIIGDGHVDELLRIDSPVQMTMRVATQPTQVAGRDIAAGSVLLCCLGAANHDPATFPDPNRIHWDRAPNPHVAFGGGIHHCLGAGLARAEARIGLTLLLERYGDLGVAGPIRRRDSFTIRGLSRLDLVGH